VLRRIFRPGGGGCGRLVKPARRGLRSLYSSHTIIRVIKPNSMRWTGDVTRKIEMRNAYRILVVNVKGRDHSEDLNVHRY
jgi:hypothetical protein